MLIQRLSRAEFDELLVRIRASAINAHKPVSALSTTKRLANNTSRMNAIGCIRYGTLTSLTRPLKADIIVEQQIVSRVDPANPNINDTGIGVRDVWKLDYHGIDVTHIDALCHIGFDDSICGDIAISEVTSQHGCQYGDIIDTIDIAVVARGVLVPVSGIATLQECRSDVQVLRRYITLEEFESSIETNHIEIQQGDCVLLTAISAGRKSELDSNLVLSPEIIEYLTALNVTCVGADFDVDGGGFGVEGIRLPVHVAAIWAAGLPLIDNLNLSSLRVELNGTSSGSFCFICAALPVRGATGSPASCFALT